MTVLRPIRVSKGGVGMSLLDTCNVRWRKRKKSVLVDERCVLLPISDSPLQPRSRDISCYNAANQREGLLSCCWDLLCPHFCFSIPSVVEV